MVKNYKILLFISLFFLIEFLWWIKLHSLGGLESSEAFWFNLSYGFIGLIGGINGLHIAKRWGGFKSLVGKSLTFLSLGLFSEWIANLIWAYYNIVAKVEVPYPSEADIFFFAIIPLYALAMFYLAKATKIGLSLKNYKGELSAILIPSIMLIIAYTLFLRQGLDTSNVIRLFFDLAYPLGEVITFSIAILTFLLTKNYLGGVMKRAVVGVIGAYLLQFIADYGFLYTALNETYYNANWVDLFYALAMFAMTLAIINFDITMDLVRSRLLSSTGVTAENHEPVPQHTKIYEKIILVVISDQEKIIGPLAIEEAKTIGGLNLDQSLTNIQITEDPKIVFKKLTDRYETLFGKASLEVIRESVQKVKKTEPDTDFSSLELNI